MYLLYQLFPTPLTQPGLVRRILAPNKKASRGGFLCIKKDLVAGAGFEPATFGL
jgi:hypothetical protein